MSDPEFHRSCSLSGIQLISLELPVLQGKTYWALPFLPTEWMSVWENEGFRDNGDLGVHDSSSFYSQSKSFILKMGSLDLRELTKTIFSLHLYSTARRAWKLYNFPQRQDSKTVQTQNKVKTLTPALKNHMSGWGGWHVGRWEGVRGDARSRHRDLVMSDFVMSDSHKPVHAGCRRMWRPRLSLSQGQWASPLWFLSDPWSGRINQHNSMGCMQSDPWIHTTDYRCPREYAQFDP